jgi:excisionase family DNA binding protein
MNVPVGQLSLLDLEAVQQAGPPTPVRHAPTRGDKPAETVTQHEQPSAQRRRGRTNNTSDDQTLLTTHEAAARLHVHPRTVQRLVERGQLSAIHLGSAVRFDPQDVEALILDVKERRHAPVAAETVRARRAVASSFADRLRSQRHEHRTAQT